VQLRPPLLVVVLVTLASLVLACESAPAVDDAGAAPDASASIGPPLPSPPTLTPCPAGWMSTMRDEIAICEPSPEGAERCEGPRFRLPGASACEPVDDACEDGEFPTGLDATRSVRHVRAGSTGGDGSEAAPFGTIEEALAGVSGPVTLALAAGTYASSPLPSDVEIQGVCAERVTITGTIDAPALVVRPGARLSLEGVTLTPASVGVLVGGELTVRRVAILGAATAGIGLIGGVLDAERVLVRDTRLADADDFGRGVSVETDARASLRHVVIEGSRESGLAVANATVEADDLAIRRTSPDGGGGLGVGMRLFERATAVIRHAALEDAVEAGIRVEAGSELTLEDSVIRDVRSSESLANGRGIFVRESLAHVRRTLIERASGAAIFATTGTTLDATDVVLADTVVSGNFAAGLGVIDSDVVAERVAVMDAAWIGIVVNGASATLTASDVIVRRVEPTAVDLGEGIVVGDGGTATFTRALLEGVHTVGAMTYGVGSSLSITDARIRHVLESPGYVVGRGAEADVGAHLTLTNVWIEDVIDTGIVSFGEGLPGTLATLVDVRIARVTERSCVTTTCTTEGGGSAVAAVFGGAVVARGLEVIGAPLCGVQVAEGGSLDVESGSITESAIGACVQIDGYDLARVVAGVEYRDNERNVESSSVYVPGGGPR
jgi:hypothetical protein